jgi:hypothetical protein
MKITHRKTLWIHSAYSVIMTTALVVLVLVRGDMPTIALAFLLFLYIGGNVYIHIKRNDFKKETLIEYLLLGFAVFVVLYSAALN